MRLPAYWARSTAEEQNAQGKPVRFSCWRWSDVNAEDAQQSALETAARLVRKFVAGEPLDRYGYGVRPLREETKQRFTDGRGKLSAAITQNRYGALVLNAAQVMFVDVDLPETSAARAIKYYFRRWFDKTARPPAQLAEAESRQRIASYFALNPGWSGRWKRRSGSSEGSECDGKRCGCHSIGDV